MTLPAVEGTEEWVARWQKVASQGWEACKKIHTALETLKDLQANYGDQKSQWRCDLEIEEALRSLLDVESYLKDALQTRRPFRFGFDRDCRAERTRVARRGKDGLLRAEGILMRVDDQNR